MEKNKIGIIGAGTGTLPTEVLRMAEEANVEIVELDKDYSPTDIPQFEDRVELFTKVQSAVLGSLQTKVPLSIMMNGTVIQEYSITE